MGKKKKKGKVRKGGEGREAVKEEVGPGPGPEASEDVAYEVVEFVYSEQPLLHYQRVDPTSFIPPTFVTDSLAACIENWNLFLPGVGITDLHAQAIPTMPEHGTFRDWSGIVHVELRDGRLDSGLCTEVTTLRQEVLQAQLTLVTKKAESQVLMEEAVEKAVRNMEGVLTKALKGQQKSIQQLQEMTSKQGKAIELLNSENIDLNDAITALKINVIDLEGIITSSTLEHQKEIHLLSEDVKGLKRLTNHVKRRTALEKAREYVILTLNKREPRFGEKWSQYFDDFSMHDWNKLFSEEDHILTHDAKELLRTGSLLANEQIHNMDAPTVLEGIMAGDVETHQRAWLWVIKSAFPMIPDDAWTTMIGKYH